MRERLIMWIVWRLPKSLVYWSAIRLGCHATQGQWGNESPADLLFMKALERW